MYYTHHEHCPHCGESLRPTSDSYREGDLPLSFALCLLVFAGIFAGALVAKFTWGLVLLALVMGVPGLIALAMGVAQWIRARRIRAVVGEGTNEAADQFSPTHSRLR